MPMLMTTTAATEPLAAAAATTAATTTTASMKRGRGQHCCPSRRYLEQARWFYNYGRSVFTVDIVSEPVKLSKNV